MSWKSDKKSIDEKLQNSLYLDDLNLYSIVTDYMRPQYLGSGSYDGTIKIWDLETGKLLKTLEGHTDGVSSLVLI